MRVAFGWKAHSGWAALVVLGAGGGSRLQVVDRRRIELVQGDEAGWAKAPYHAAMGLAARDARALVRRSVQVVHRNAARAMRACVRRAAADGHEVSAVAVLMGEPMPDWSADEILAVHFRMHKAEGMLFRAALAQATVTCGVRLVAVRERQLQAEAARALGTSPRAVTARIAALGKSLGPPWGKDQKDAALAAMIALRRRRRASARASAPR